MQNLINSMDQLSADYCDKQLRLAIHLDNCKQWLSLDQKATELEWVIIPVPHFFSVNQISHLITKAGVNTVVCNQKLLTWYQSQGFTVVDKSKDDIYLLVNSVVKPTLLPDNTHKITFTSGTTSEPKGVCLSLQHLNTVGRSLAKATEQFALKKHISLLPYSVLLENMAAVYANKYAHLEVISLPMKDVGLTGSGHFIPQVMVDALLEHRADSMILMPQMLKQLIYYLNQEKTDLSFIKFIAVGGAVCSKQLISSAHEAGLPVYQGYGISECGSVISLNLENKASDTVGKPLNHCEISIDQGSEIWVKGPQFIGYLGDESTYISPEKQIPNRKFATGDIGIIDDSGSLKITGRKKNIIINSFGRNILPDWIEGELLAIPGVLQVAIYGEAKPFLTAICVTQLNKKQLNNCISEINKSLPDYAQVTQFIVVTPFTVENGQLTPSGKIRHQQIFNDHKQSLEKIYATSIEKTAHAI